MIFKCFLTITINGGALLTEIHNHLFSFFQFSLFQRTFHIYKYNKNFWNFQIFFIIFCIFFVGREGFEPPITLSPQVFTIDYACNFDAIILEVIWSLVSFRKDLQLHIPHLDFILLPSSQLGLGDFSNLSIYRFIYFLSR